MFGSPSQPTFSHQDISIRNELAELRSVVETLKASSAEKRRSIPADEGIESSEEASPVKPAKIPKLTLTELPGFDCRQPSRGHKAGNDKGKRDKPKVRNYMNNEDEGLRAYYQEQKQQLTKKRNLVPLAEEPMPTFTPRESYYGPAVTKDRNRFPKRKSRINVLGVVASIRRENRNRKMNIKTEAGEMYTRFLLTQKNISDTRKEIQTEREKKNKTNSEPVTTKSSNMPQANQSNNEVLIKEEVSVKGSRKGSQEEKMEVEIAEIRRNIQEKYPDNFQDWSLMKLKVEALNKWATDRHLHKSKDSGKGARSVVLWSIRGLNREFLECSESLARKGVSGINLVDKFTVIMDLGPKQVEAAMRKLQPINMPMNPNTAKSQHPVHAIQPGQINPVHAIQPGQINPVHAIQPGQINPTHAIQSGQINPVHVTQPGQINPYNPVANMPMKLNTAQNINQTNTIQPRSSQIGDPNISLAVTQLEAMHELHKDEIEKSMQKMLNERFEKEGRRLTWREQKVSDDETLLRRLKGWPITHDYDQKFDRPAENIPKLNERGATTGYKFQPERSQERSFSNQGSGQYPAPPIINYTYNIANPHDEAEKARKAKMATERNRLQEELRKLGEEN